MQSIKSIIKKSKTIIENGSLGIEAIREGVNNYNTYSQDIEDIAQLRINNCVNCEHYKEEPNFLLKIEDTSIIEADDMMCNDCGCALPYKIRQNVIKCDKWQI